VTLGDQVRYTFLKKLINQCVHEKSIVNNKYIIPYLKTVENTIATKVGKEKLEETI